MSKMLGNRTQDAKLAKQFGWMELSRIDDSVGFGSDLKGSINCGRRPDGELSYIPFYTADVGALMTDFLKATTKDERLTIEFEKERSTIAGEFGVRINRRSWTLAETPALALAAAVAKYFNLKEF